MKVKRHLTHYASRRSFFKTKACHLPRKEKKKGKKIALRLSSELAALCLLNITPAIYGDAEFKAYAY